VVVAGSNGNLDRDPDVAAVLARYQPDGTLDNTFGSGGVVITHLSDSSSAYNKQFSVSALVLQPDGKLVVGGDTDANSGDDFALVRYLPDGMLDETFGTTGRVVTDAGGHVFDQLASLVLQPDGKLIAAGGSYDGYESHLAMVRYQPDGALDDTFGVNGRVASDFYDEDLAEGMDGVAALVVQPDGKLVVVNGKSLVRYHPEGTLDKTFGSEGIATSGEQGWIGSDLVLQPDGKIVLSYHENDHRSPTFLLARFNSDGSLDESFGTAGRSASAPFPGGALVGFTDLALQPDGKLVLTDGFLVDDGQQRFALARNHPDGSIDDAFGEGGRVSSRFPQDAFAHGVALQPDGRVVVIGTTGNDDEHDFALARYAG
jgi:uncharacterized delta-60 repeat protein